MSNEISPAAISRMIAAGVADEVMRGVSCDAHGDKPEITIVEAEPDGFEYSISGCCEDLRKKTRSAIDELLGRGAPQSSPESATDV